jgi:OOP family OmpA-OmpF porin
VKFSTGNAYIEPVSYELLDSVVQVLNDAPSMRLRIEGHTDALGGDDVNLRLSRERAEAVRAYLMSKGVSEARVEASGFGEVRPIDTNRTEKGRALNRRVEFHILE